MDYAATPNVMPDTAPLDLDADLRRARQLAMLLDAQFQVAGIRFGMDAIVGLIPGVGDLLTTLAGAYPLYLAHRHSLGRWTLARMAGNLTLDFLAGSVPVVGDLFDVAFKANLKNLAILEAAAAKQKARHR